MGGITPAGRRIDTAVSTLTNDPPDPVSETSSAPEGEAG